MYDLPEWTINLRPLYACLRAYKRNKTLRRSYYRKIEKEKLRLAEEGINQEKIRLACRFLASFSCVRNYQCDACKRMYNSLFSIDEQMVLELVFK